jgi:hypothetical protein
MWRLVKYLEENGSKEALSKNQSELARKLCEIWPATDDDCNKPSREHEELAVVVMSAMWLGSRAQEIKESAGDKSAEKFFREAMIVAFETGRRLAISTH